MHGLFSVKFDVFSFGVLVLEIITGRKNSSSNHGIFLSVQECLLTSVSNIFCLEIFFLHAFVIKYH
jgi:DNA-directed RNA polymerase subunit E'/Rpb7